MLKITTKHEAEALRLVLEGRLAGPWLKELEQFWRHMMASERGTLVVDLRGVTFIEETGKTLLAEMWREGAELLATGCCNKSIIEHITGSRSHSPSTQRERRA